MIILFLSQNICNIRQINIFFHYSSEYFIRCFIKKILLLCKTIKVKEIVKLYVYTLVSQNIMNTVQMLSYSSLVHKTSATRFGFDFPIYC